MSSDPRRVLRESELSRYLVERGLASAGTQIVAVEPAGDGNINWVRRVRAATGESWIVKQARSHLERFPEYAAPTERIVFERRYLEIARPFDSERVLPEVLAFDEENRVLVLPDLGDAERLDRALARGADIRSALTSVAGLLGRVHAATRDSRLTARFANDAMRRLHGEHIFQLPLRPNDFPLATEVRTLADAWRDDRAVVAAADRAYARYLEPRGALLHGDVQPGNVLLTEAGPKLLDAEIAHVGDPAFDVGVLIGHVVLAALSGPRRPCADAEADVVALWAAYRAGAGEGAPDFAEAARYAGLEMMRRTIGAARVALVDGPRAAAAVLERSRQWLLSPPESPEEMELR